MAKHRWYILGAGAIGCLWASYWRQSGVEVVLLTPTRRDTSLLTLTHQHATIEVDIQSVTLEDFAKSSHTIHHLLVTTKAQNTLDAIRAIAPNLAENASVLILQNGMAAKNIETLLPSQKLFIGITNDGAFRTAPLAVTYAGRGKTLIGSYQADNNIPALIQQLPTHYLDIDSCADIELRQWQKLAINAAINGLTVLYHCRNGGLLDSPAALQQMKALCAETATIARALGLPEQLFDDLYQQAQATARLTADNFSSMYQDIQQGRPTEIDFINGYLCREATRLGLNCPEHQRLVAAIKQQQAPSNHD